jgi:hypothetical protein
LARTLVEAGGCPQLQEIVATVEDTRSAVTGRSLGVHDAAASASVLNVAFARLDELVAAADGHKHTRLAADVARSAVVELIREGPGGSYESMCPTQVAESVCWRILDHYHFDAQRPLLIGERFANYEEARAWQREVSQIIAPHVATIAQGLARDPTGQHVRKPRWPQQVVSTAEALRSAVPLGPRGRKS